jgi:hypothetical protein
MFNELKARTKLAIKKSSFALLDPTMCYLEETKEPDGEPKKVSALEGRGFINSE